MTAPLNEPTSPTDACLNCGTEVSDKFCPHCGQKVQSIRVPFRDLFGEIVATFLNFDGLWWRTLRELMLRPGKVTRAYLDGKRASYLPPLRTYLSVSVVYFLALRLHGPEQVLFINFDVGEEGANAVGSHFQYALFFLVPLLAAVLRLLFWKRRGFYVEYLVFAVHLHSVWFVLFSLKLVLDWLLGFGSGGVINVLLFGSAGLTQLLPFVYLVISLRRVFGSSWMISIGTAITSIIFYTILMAGFVVGVVYLQQLNGSG